MVHKNKLDKIAGPSGTFSGYVLLTFGLIATFFSLTGIIVVLLGILLAFAFNCSEIDSEKRIIRSGIIIFRWTFFLNKIEINDSYRLEIKHVKAKYSVYSASNRKLDIAQTDYRIYIYSSEHLNRILLAKFLNLVEAQKEIENFRNLIKVEIATKS
jgi:hypothetical protein